MPRLLPTAMAAAAAAFVLTSATVASCAEPDDEVIHQVAADDPGMNAQIAKARRTLPRFLAELARRPGAEDLTFKYPLAGWEHIWVGAVRRQGDRLVGRLANTPEEPGYVWQQVVAVPLADISDWGFRDARGVMQGHYTTRYLLPRLSLAEAAALRQDMGWQPRKRRPSKPAMPFLHEP